MATQYQPVYAGETLTGIMVKTDRGSYFVQRRLIGRGNAYTRGLNTLAMARDEVDKGIERMMRENRAAGL